MRIFVKAKAGAKENKVIPPQLKLLKESSDDGEEYYAVSVKELPRQGKANEAIRKILSEYFRVSLGNIRLVSGGSSKKKVFEVS